MKKVMKKQFAALFSFVLLFSFCVGVIPTKAESTTVAITDVSQTKAIVSVEGLVSAYQAVGRVITAYKVTLDGAVLADNYTKVGYLIENLAPGSTHTLAITPYYYNAADSLRVSNVGQDEVITFTTQAAPTVEAPKIERVLMAKTQAVVSANIVTAKAYEYRICKKNGKTVATQTLTTAKANFSNIPANQVYYAQVRAYDLDEAGNKIYSAWSAKKYFVPQPISTSTNSDVKKHSVNFKWKKVKGAASYTVYMKKHNAKKYVKVKTVKKNRYVYTKFKGAQINTTGSGYDIKVVANAKVKGKMIHSNGLEAITVSTYYRYR